jgi:phage baseplate assembly protein W
MTNPGERVGRPFFGVGLKNRIFEPMDEVTTQNVKEQIIEQINQYEPRADLTTVDVTFDEPNNTIMIKIGFKKKNDVNGEERFINLGFELEV